MERAYMPLGRAVAASSRAVASNVRTDTPADSFGGASGGSKARLFEVYGYAILACNRIAAGMHRAVRITEGVS
jgi:hypothetical protein